MPSSEWFAETFPEREDSRASAAAPATMAWRAKYMQRMVVLTYYAAVTWRAHSVEGAEHRALPDLRTRLGERGQPLGAGGLEHRAAAALVAADLRLQCATGAGARDMIV